MDEQSFELGFDPRSSSSILGETVDARSLIRTEIGIETMIQTALGPWFDSIGGIEVRDDHWA
jgi:hypothetical protein